MKRDITPVFSMRGLEIRYPEFRLGPLDLDLAPGSVLALIGPNGAGKTSLLHSLVGLREADAGAIEIAGRDAHADAAWKAELGFVGDEHAFFEDWNGRANLRFLAGFRPNWDRERAENLARRFDLDLDRKLRRLSRGNRCKLALVAALAHSPRLLVLDEPSSGLDPVVRAEFLDCLRELQEDEGRGIIYSTHILSDIERLADELAFLDGGRLLTRASLTELQDSWARLYFRLPDSAPELPGESGRPGVPGMPGMIEMKREDGRCMVLSSRAEECVARLTELGADEIMKTGLDVSEIAVHILKQARGTEGRRA